MELYPYENFNVDVDLLVNSSLYKKPVEDLIKSLDQAKGDYIPYSTVNGLDSITGTLVYKITFPQALKSDPTFTVSSSTESCIGSNVQVTKEQNNTYSLSLSVDWGKLFSTEFDADASENKNYVSFFKDASNFPDLELSLTSNSLTFAEQPTAPNTLRFSGTFNSCNMGKNVVSVTYSYLESDKNSKPGAGTLKEKENSKPLNSSLPVSSQSVVKADIVWKKTKPNSSKPSTPQQPTTPVVPSGPQTVMRLYNPNTGEHLFTTSEAERMNLASLGWNVENNDWATPDFSDMPIYRVYNPNNGDHHYTPSADEVKALVSYGWLNEGTKLYSATEDGGIAIYRLYNPNADGAGSHHYTSSSSECSALQELGWNFEGVAWYGLRK